MSKLLCKQIYIILFSLAIAGGSWSQSNQDLVHWQQSVGGVGDDRINDIVRGADGTIYVVGSVQSSENQSMEIFVANYSKDGRELWSQTIGDSGDDRGIAIELLNNELHVLASSNSTKGVFSGNFGREDVYLFRVSLAGEQLGLTHFTGNYSDIPTDISKTVNGDLLITAYSRSDEGYFNTNKGQTDMWVFRLNAAGESIWKKNLGGTEDDFAVRVKELYNGELVVFGHSTSFDGDIGTNYGDFDLSLFKLSSTGMILWEQNYGGQQGEVGVDLFVSDEAHIFLAANTLSNSYDIQKNAGSSDAWVLEINPMNGEIIWEETHGGSKGDYAVALASDGKNGLYLMGGTAASFFYGESSLGGHDVWLAKVNSPDAIEHVALFGGNGFDLATNFEISPDGVVLLVGSSESTNGLFSENGGKSDGWMMKFALGETSVEQVSVSAHPNPSNGLVYLNNLTANDEIQVHNTMGQLVLAPYQVAGVSERIDLTFFLPGVYLIHIQHEYSSELIRIVRN